jgi:HEAT repeat protein
VEALGRVGGPAARAIVVQLIGGLGDSPPTPELVAAAGALRAEEAVATLSEWLRAGSVTLRMACLNALVEIGSAPAIRAVEGAFEQTQVDALRAAAARALARSGRKKLLPKMIQGLRQAPGLDVRAACADALGLLGGQNAEAALVESLAHDSGLVREHAARALLKLHGGMTDEVQKLADDTDAEVAMVVRKGGEGR